MPFQIGFFRFQRSVLFIFPSFSESLRNTIALALGHFPLTESPLPLSLVIQSHPPPVQFPEANAIPHETRRDSRDSSFFDSKIPIDEYYDDLEMGGRRGGETGLSRGIGSKRDKGRKKSKASSKSGGGKKATMVPKVDIDIELGTVADDRSNNPYTGHYNLKRPRPTTTTTYNVVDYSKRLEVDLVKSSLSLPTLEYSPR